MMRNKNLQRARRAKNDEFYTQIQDIEKELNHYKDHFKNKIVLCNCRDNDSEFKHYFTLNFDQLGLKKLITTDGDFRSEECIELLKESDIVCTNPPFSLFREYVAQLIKYEKKFLIIGNGNAITYKEIFPLIKDGRMWLGVTGPQVFLIKNKKDFAKYCSDKNKVIINDEEYWAVNISVGTPTYWYTNLPHKKRNEELILTKKYNEKDYPKYDNYFAWEVGKVINIPIDTEIEIILTEDEFEELKKTDYEFEVVEMLDEI